MPQNALDDKAEPLESMITVDLSQAHRLLTPRLVCLLGTRSQHGEPNLAPISYIAPVSRSPQLVIAAVHRQSMTHENLTQRAGFTLSIPRKRHLESVWRLGEKFSQFKPPANQTKLDACGLSVIDLSDWHGPLLGDAIGYLSCDLAEVVTLQTPSDHGIFVGEIRSAMADVKDVYNDGTYIGDPRPLLHVYENCFASADALVSIPFFD